MVVSPDPQNQPVPPENFLGVTKQSQSAMLTGKKRSNSTSPVKRNKSSMSSKNLYYDKATEQLNDSDLESQMDDYMIKSVTDSSSDNSKRDSIADDSGSGDSVDSFGEKVDPQNVVLEKMEGYYDKNYKNYSVCTNDNIMDEKVWNIFYDDTNDYVYVFLAKVHQIKGKRKIKKELDERFFFMSEGQNSVEPTEFDSTTDGFMSIAQDQKPYVYYTNCQVQIDLVLQVWNVDDRIMRDKDHRQRAMATKQVLHKIETIDQSMNTFQHMNYLQKLYQHYAQLVQADTKIHFFTGDKCLLTFNTKQKKFVSGRLKRKEQKDDQQFGNNVKTLQYYLHFKDVGTPNQGVETLFQFKYVIQERQKDDGRSPMGLGRKTDLGVTRRSKYKAYLVLQQIDYKYLEGKQSNDKARSIKYIESGIQIKDEGLLNYYLDNSAISFFIQRLMYSNTYLIIYPTGLLQLVNSQPFNIQNEIQLNIKKDERIIDYCYCISECYKKHCVWLMDEKLQIWKCQNEMNPASTNWILSKYQTFENLYYRRFLRPAMTYENFYMQTVLNKLKAISKVIEIEGDNAKHMLIAYNGTTTKAIMVNQPNFMSEEKGKVLDNESEARSSHNLLESFQKQPSLVKDTKTYKGMQIRINLVAKKQNIILNQITKTYTMSSHLQQALNDQISKQANQIRKQQYQHQQNKSMVQGWNDLIGLRQQNQYKDIDLREKMISDNEIQELVFMGKIDKSLVDFKGSSGEKHQFVRQYIIRRKRTLETMVTNGLSFQTYPIQSSFVPPPMHIYDVTLSQDKQKLIAFISTEMGENASYKTFRLSSGKKFVEYEDEVKKELSNPKNVKMDQAGNLYEVNIELVRSTKSRKKPKEYMQVEKYPHQLKIQIPECILIDEMVEMENSFERVVLSADGRLVICGMTIIQLSKNKDDIERIGCFIYDKNSSNDIVYKFLSLIDDRDVIKSHLKKRKKRIIQFDPQNPPISPEDRPHVMYLTNCFDEQTGDTSLMKIKTNTLECFEIYQSNYKVANLSMNEQKNDQEFNTEYEQVGGKGSTVSNDRSPSSIPQISNSMIWGASDIKRFLEGKGKKKHNKIHKKVFLSLLSQTKNQINIEIVSDPNIDDMMADEKEETSSQSIDSSDSQNDDKKKTKNRRGSFAKQFTGQITAVVKLNQLASVPPKLQKLNAQLEKFLSINIREELHLGSEIGWININQMILTLNNDFYLMNLRHTDLKKVKNGLQYGIQQVSMGLFCSIVKKHSSRNCPIHSCETDKERELIQLNHKREQKVIKNQITESTKSIIRMEIASLKRYVFLRQAFLSDNQTKKSLLFFTPTEELNGSNIFSKVSSKIIIMQPYLDQIDMEFINLMNANVQNIAMYVNQRFVIVNNLKINFDMLDLDKVAKQVTDRSESNPNQESLIEEQGKVHMYQKDISGQSVIDYAFDKKAIFCIKAFVETLLILSNDQENQFRNCFDKAILLMIEKGMDVKELVNSELLFPQIWQGKSVFSAIQDAKIVPYNGDLDDLEFKDPVSVFAEIDGKKNITEKEDEVDEDDSQYLERSVRKKIKQIGIPADLKEIARQRKRNQRHEEYEMKFNYIYMKELEVNGKLSVSKTLQDNQDDIELFRQDVIRHIIDYKWETYGKNFQLLKFYLYSIFLIFYYLDLESIHEGVGEVYTDKRTKEKHFYTYKGICCLIQLLFLLYEFYQMWIEGQEYLYNPWNYLELCGLFLFYYGAALDILHETISDQVRMIFVLSVLLSLIKFVYLVRVFKQLNSLVTMLTTVVQEVKYFMVLFLCFLVTFAECNHLVMVDIGAYERTPALLAHILSVLRCAMGDFSLIDPYMTFDINTEDENGNPVEYRHTYNIMMFTWLIYVISVFFLFMIFMNFIIAVIGDSYNQVYPFREEYDYLQRCTMNYERETHFGPEQLASKVYFPDVLIIRKKKDNEGQNNSWQTWMLNLKNQIKAQSASYVETLSVKSKEQKQHFSNSIKKLENDIVGISNGLEQIFGEVRKINDHDHNPCGSDSSSTQSENNETTMTDQPVKGKRKSRLQSAGKIKKAKILINNMMDQEPVKQSPKNPLRSPQQVKKSMTLNKSQLTRKSSFDDALQTNEYKVSSSEFKQLKDIIFNKFQDMDIQMQSIMEMQKQNQFYIKQSVQTQNLCYQENERNFKSLAQRLSKDLSDFKLQSSQILSPAGGGDLDLMQMRGQQVMNQLGNNFGNLPMSRGQVDYPKSPSKGVGYKQKKKSKEQQPLIMSFNGSVDHDEYEQIYRGRSRSPPARPKSTNTVKGKYLNMESNEESEFEFRNRQEEKKHPKKKY